MTPEEKKERVRELRLKKLFNISAAEYNAISYCQGDCCAICRLPASTFKTRLAIDHDHKTGLIRGLLCSMCNRAIAKFRDNAEKLQSAANYLKSPPATIALGGERYGLKGRVTNKAATRKRLNKIKT